MIPTTMHAVVTTGHGDLDRLNYTMVPVPRPAADEVLVRVTACGINNTEIWAREGRYGTEEDPYAVAASNRQGDLFPLIQGCDIVGSIAAVGEGVPAGRIGERVVVASGIFADKEGTKLIGSIGGASRRNGGYAEYAVVPAGNAFAVQSDWTDAELATLPAAYTTAESMLVAAEVGEGNLVAVSGASGGVGSALVQLAHARGAKVVALTSARKVDQVRSLGPDTVVAVDGDARIALRDALAGRRLDAALDVVAGTVVMPLLNGLRPQGIYVVSGAAGGFMVSFDIRTVYAKRLRLVGTGPTTRQQFRKVVAEAEAGRIRPLLSRAFPLKDIREAHAYFKSKDFFGKLVVIPEHA